MPYIPHTKDDVRRMLAAIGASSVEELLNAVPSALRTKTPLNVPDGLSEQEIAQRLKELSLKNSTVEDHSSFLGAGAYNHYIPSTVRALASRSEFYTAYTPYQPEVSQGTLQAIFEYQTMVCQLTSMDVANASLYDGATAVAEAVLMARRITGKKGVLLSRAVHPEYRETVRTYLKEDALAVTEAAFSAETGATLASEVEGAADDALACVVVQHPNFFGSLEDVASLADVAHKKKALLIIVVNEAVSLGLLKPPAELGADIAVGEFRSFGNPLNYGGPYLGFMAAKTEFVRQMPGRLIGETVDKNGRRAFCLTFSTREQHIRRERATSNICTNHGLCALLAAIHIASLGATGVENLARTNLSKAEYLKGRLGSIAGVKIAFSSPTFNEFTVKTDVAGEDVLKKLLKKRIIGGLNLKGFYPELASHILVCATEMNSKKDMDAFIDAVAG